MREPLCQRDSCEEWFPLWAIQGNVQSLLDLCFYLCPLDKPLCNTFTL